MLFFELFSSSLDGGLNGGESVDVDAAVGIFPDPADDADVVDDA